MLIQQLFTSPINFIISFLTIVISITVHEFAHAYTAYKLGDFTAKSEGRVTLNPLAHLDPLGTFLIIFAGFGWGKPVPFNPNNLENPKRDTMLIALAGPLSNLLMAICAVILLNFNLPGLVAFSLIPFIWINIVLMLFNLLPLDPLDGYKILLGLIPTRSVFFDYLIDFRPYGIYVLIVLLISDYLDLLYLQPASSFFVDLLTKNLLF